MNSRLSRLARSIFPVLGILLCPSRAGATDVILLIGDGMGMEQVRAAGIYANGAAGTLSFESWPVKSWARTDSSMDSPTDSAAAATAMATGRKVKNDVVSMAIPGDGEPVTTILEIARDLGKRTGVVTTTELTHATPACFASHANDRGHTGIIAEQMLTKVRPNLILGGGDDHLTTAAILAADYHLVENAAQLAQLGGAGEHEFVAGRFGNQRLPYEWDGVGDLPHLSDMVSYALRYMEDAPKGFFLMIEGGRIDHAGHSNDLQRNIGETIEFAKAAQLVADWVRTHPDTLVILTADHETGGMQIVKDNGKGVLPEVTWKWKKHTEVDVPLIAMGPGSRKFLPSADNTTIFYVMQEALLGRIEERGSRQNSM